MQLLLYLGSYCNMCVCVCVNSSGWVRIDMDTLKLLQVNVGLLMSTNFGQISLDLFFFISKIRLDLMISS
jgi:hypothetical protein